MFLEGTALYGGLRLAPATAIDGCVFWPKKTGFYKTKKMTSRSQSRSRTSSVFNWIRVEGSGFFVTAIENIRPIPIMLHLAKL